MKKSVIVLTVICVLLVFSACSVGKISSEKLRDLEFTVVKEEDIPEELKGIIEEKKEQVFKVTFADQGMLYIAEGYGVQNTSGYSIEVVDCFETENAIYFRSNLIGPSESEKVAEEKTYPYVVVKLELIDKHIVFQ